MRLVFDDLEPVVRKVDSCQWIMIFQPAQNWTKNGETSASAKGLNIIAFNPVNINLNLMCFNDQ